MAGRAVEATRRKTGFLHLYISQHRMQKQSLKYTTKIIVNTRYHKAILLILSVFFILIWNIQDSLHAYFSVLEYSKLVQNCSKFFNDTDKSRLEVNMQKSWPNSKSKSGIAQITASVNPIQIICILESQN